MDNWVSQLRQLLQHDAAVVLVSVLRVQGSVPRRPGASMCVTGLAQSGTIGGGQLEYQAAVAARELLFQRHKAPMRKVYSLGPALGQCCGGTVQLLFEYITVENSPLQLSAQAVRRAISNTAETRFEAFSQGLPAKNADNNVLALVDEDGTEFLISATNAEGPEVWVFGAGHVGQAVVAQLSLLPCRIKWLDEREGIFPDQVPSSVSTCCCDSIVDELVNAPDYCCIVVMTHSHALDFDICRAALQRPFPYVGLIGSKTKSAGFKKRLLRRDIDEQNVTRLVCPIGIGDISSNEPHAIAISLATQLMAYW